MQKYYIKNKEMKMIKISVIIGFIFKIFGLIWTVSNKIICDYLCAGGCGNIQNTNCSFLLLFVGIIFIVCGYALIVMKDERRMKLEKKMIDDFFSILKSV